MAKIEVSAEIEIYEEDLDDRLLRAAAEALLTQVNLSGRYGGKVVETIDQKLAEIVAERVEAMLDRKITQVDRFGDVLPGTQKAFREIFADQAEKFLEQRVNSDGRTVESGWGTSSQSRLEYLLRKTGTEHMEHTCRQVAEQFKAELKERATKAIAAVVAEHVKRAG